MSIVALNETELQTHRPAGPEGLRKVRLELGRRWMSARDAACLDVGSILLLDCSGDEPVDILADGQVIARGHPVAVAGKLAAQVQQVV